jgi:4-diphosphocytidyl-2-C-methyl-D-erythritol kinase
VALTLPLRARAPAKLNLCLYVGTRRTDGLHQICSLFQAVSLADDVEIERGDEFDEVVCPGVNGPNLALDALERFRAEVGLGEPAIRVTIRKRIPVAAGLGGGSADAAAVLRICAALRAIDPRGLRDLAMSLGADVPAQLVPGAHLVCGAGERVERADPLEGLACVLLSGVGALDTGSVYERADATGPARTDLGEIESRLRAALARAGGDPLALADLMHNDLEAAAVELEPAAARALEVLYQEGAAVARVSGSGPAALGLFPTREEADRAASALGGRWEGAVDVVEAVGSAYAATASLSGSGQ